MIMLFSTVSHDSVFKYLYFIHIQNSSELLKMRMESEIKDKIIKLEEDALVKAALGMKLQNFHNSTLYYYYTTNY